MMSLGEACTSAGSFECFLLAFIYTFVLLPIHLFVGLFGYTFLEFG